MSVFLTLFKQVYHSDDHDRMRISYPIMFITNRSLESKASCKTPNSEVETFCHTLLVLSQKSRYIELVSIHSYPYTLSWFSFYPLFLHLCYTVET